MTAMNPPVEPATLKNLAIPRERKFDTILGRIDLLAIVLTLLGVCLLGAVAIVMAVIEMAKLVSCLWADPAGRWGLIALGVALVWVAARWKKSCVV
jgi:hypothetical protein